ncbi:MAG TPA: flavin reductase family protein [Pilimelia sp.]|nr:flavin reductase family protein [Pilimelia sp.]
MPQPDPGAHIHLTDPFGVPGSDRSPLRRLRGRLPAPVTLWTAYASDGSPAGLTVSSTLVADGQPGGVLGLVDEESDLWAAVRDTGRFAVAPLRAADRQLADRFAGLLPTPGGPFRAAEWRATPFGPVPATALTWAGCRLARSRPVGWALLVEGEVDTVTVGEDAEPLVHFRGRYRRLDPPG